MADAPDTSLPPPYLDIAGDAGPWLTGVLVNSTEFGALIVLVGIYFIRYGGKGKDRWWYQALVTALTVLSAIVWSFDFCFVWYYLITTRNYSRIKSSSTSIAFARSDWGLILSPKISIVPFVILPFSSLLTQTYFCLRAYRLTHRQKWVGILFAFLVIGGFSVGMCMSLWSLLSPGRTVFFNGTDLKNFSGVKGKGNEFWISVHLLEGFLGITALTDVLTTIILTIYLLPLKQNFNPRTDAFITRIIQLSFLTGFVSSLHSLLDVFLAIGTVHNNNAHITTCVSQAHCYAIVLVVTLLFRRDIDPYGVGKNSGKGFDGGVKISDSFETNGDGDPTTIRRNSGRKSQTGSGGFSLGQGVGVGFSGGIGSGGIKTNSNQKGYHHYREQKYNNNSFSIPFTGIKRSFSSSSKLLSPTGSEMDKKVLVTTTTELKRDDSLISKPPTYPDLIYEKT